MYIYIVQNMQQIDKFHIDKKLDMPLIVFGPQSGPLRTFFFISPPAIKRDNGKSPIYTM